MWPGGCRAAMQSINRRRRKGLANGPPAFVALGCAAAAQGNQTDHRHTPRDNVPEEGSPFAAKIYPEPLPVVNRFSRKVRGRRG